MQILHEIEFFKIQNISLVHRRNNFLLKKFDKNLQILIIEKITEFCCFEFILNLFFGKFRKTMRITIIPITRKHTINEPYFTRFFTYIMCYKA